MGIGGDNHGRADVDGGGGGEGGGAGIAEVEDADPELPEIPAAPDPAPAAPGERAKLRRAIRVGLPIVIGAGVLWVALSSAGGVTRSIDLLHRLDGRWLAAALGAEVVTYGALSLHLRYLGGPDANVRRLAPFRLALVVFGLGAVLPAAPAEGLVMAGSALRRRRLAKRRAVLVLGLSQWFSSAGLYAVAAVNALVVVTVSRLPLPDRPALAVVAIAALLSLACLMWLGARPGVAEWGAVAADRARFWRPRPAPAESRERGAAWHAAVAHVVSGRRGLLYLFTTSALAWLADAACLHFALLAFGARVSPEVLLFAYTAGTLASMVPLLPAGLGVVETVTPAVLGLAGVPLTVALAAIVVYRAVGTLLPALAGGAALVALHVEDPGEFHRSAAVDGIADAGDVAAPVAAVGARLTAG